MLCLALPRLSWGLTIDRVVAPTCRLLLGGDASQGEGKGEGEGEPRFHIYIVEQSDDARKFNRGKLLNIGYRLAAASSHHSVYVFHDVDLLPSPDLAPHYLAKPAGGPVHIARVWGRYSGNPKYIGGAVAFTGEDFGRINGFPNTFWGWGGEDDEMRRRIDEVNRRQRCCVGEELGKQASDQASTHSTYPQYKQTNTRV